MSGIANGVGELAAAIIRIVLWKKLHRDAKKRGQAVVVGQESIYSMLHRRGLMQ